jgi:hypothetical protein
MLSTNARSTVSSHEAFGSIRSSRGGRSTRGAAPGNRQAQEKTCSQRRRCERDGPIFVRPCNALLEQLGDGQPGEEQDQHYTHQIPDRYDCAAPSAAAPSPAHHPRPSFQFIFRLPGHHEQDEVYENGQAHAQRDAHQQPEQAASSHHLSASRAVTGHHRGTICVSNVTSSRTSFKYPATFVCYSRRSRRNASANHARQASLSMLKNTSPSFFTAVFPISTLPHPRKGPGFWRPGPFRVQGSYLRGPTRPRPAGCANRTWPGPGLSCSRP